MRRVGVVALVTLPAAGAIAAALSCNDAITYVYAAAPFDTTQQCLGPYAPLDVVDGTGNDGNDNCAPICLVSSGSIYVSTVCPPYPPALDTSGQNAECGPALAAYARQDDCYPDGGSTNPIGIDTGVVPTPTPMCDEAGADEAGVCCDQGGACGTPPACDEAGADEAGVCCDEGGACAAPPMCDEAGADDAGVCCDEGGACGDGGSPTDAPPG
jgi:hypothetical protein